MHSTYANPSHSFVDRDMFMRFRGGGIGHKVTREWDEFLQREGRKPPPNDEDVEPIDLQPEDSESELEDEIEQDGQGGDEPSDTDSSSSDSDGSDESEDDEDDILIADEGEELDEAIWAQEGYDAL